MAKLRKNRYYHHKDYPDGGFFYRINYMDDLLSRKENYTHQFRKLRELLGTKEKERKAMQKAKAVVYDFLDMLTEDMIQNDTYFVFPRRKYGYLKIRPVRKEDMKNYPFWIQTMGEYFAMRHIINKDIIKSTGKVHLVQLSQRLRKKLDDQILIKGYRYR